MKVIKFNKGVKQAGIVTLSISAAVLLTSLLMTMYSANSTKLEHQAYNSDYISKQAFEAAEAGLEYGIKYLEKNKSQIIQLDLNGQLISTNTTVKGSQSNNSSYTVTFSNPTPNDTSLIKITVSGVSQDGNVKTVSQLMKYNPALSASMPPVAFTSGGDVDMGGSPLIANFESTIALWGGQTVTADSNTTVVNSSNAGGKIKGTVNPDALVENDANLAAMTEDDLFTNYFGNNKTKVKTLAENFFTVTSNSTEVETLNDKLVWFEGDLHLNKQVILGSPTNPVILIVNGDLNMNGGAQIYGFVFINGNLDKGNGDAQINGSIVVKGNSITRGTIDIYYNSAVLNAIRQGLGVYSKVPGSWKDS